VRVKLLPSFLLDTRGARIRIAALSLSLSLSLSFSLSLSLSRLDRLVGERKGVAVDYYANLPAGGFMRLLRLILPTLRSNCVSASAVVRSRFNDY